MWIDKKERLPAAEDMDVNKCVRVWHVYQGEMVTGALQLELNRYLTHWQPCDAPPEGIEEMKRA